jgi:hypothetical protein
MELELQYNDWSAFFSLMTHLLSMVMAVEVSAQLGGDNCPIPSTIWATASS